MKALKHTLIALCCLISGMVAAQSTPQTKLEFKTLHDMPYRLVWPATVTDGQYIYAVNGYVPAGGGYSANALKYDPQTDKWVTFSRNVGYKTQAAAVYTGDGNTYIFGGREFSGHRIFQGVQKLDMRTGESTILNVSNPIAATYACATIWDNKVYLFGGTRDAKQTIASLYQFDPTILKFTKLADMPENLQTAGTIVNGVLYTFGGYDEFLHRASQSINAYDIKTNTWHKVGKFPQSVSANCVAASGNLIFVVGNYDDESFLGYFDVNTQKFTQLKSNMEPRRAAGVAIIDNKLYVFGGTSKFHNEVGGMNSVQIADISALVNAYSASR
ncbi:Kelch repeat-containing protein [Mucilaginibacter jinjuensis]|uniref:Kelch repeat-containing protein n=1 Tax=Mucilaginibacter jinjuensis TaxID=1176721 RepID=A0ABY7T851_9SPHI|nr:kelch repeat-containing protein [Mucilaginibacter jinjuensis]WCT12586.1 kelch repeat-containing protein [Mucilaginibacter jinjuensis]